MQAYEIAGRMFVLVRLRNLHNLQGFCLTDNGKVGKLWISIAPAQAWKRDIPLKLFTRSGVEEGGYKVHDEKWRNLENSRSRDGNPLKYEEG